MNEEEILIIGGYGQLGRALQQKYPKAIAVDSDALDITSQEALKNFDWDKVKIIINVAAFTNVDAAETADGRIAAWKVNALAVSYVTNIAREHDILLLHISTDYVFDGTLYIHAEDEPYSPLSVYGASKAAGDIAASVVERHYIIRTSWLIGDGRNFVRTMLELGKKGINPSVVSDQIGRLTFTAELVRAIDFLLTKNPTFGTYNVSDDGEPASWADITRKIYELSNYPSKVTNTSTTEYNKGKDDVAPRPLRSTLDLTKLHTLGFKSKNWVDDLEDYLQKETSK